MRVRRSCTSTLLFAALVAACATPGLYAQQTTRDLSGTVTDASHEPLRGAVVQLEDETTHAVVSYITSRTGEYSFKRISGEANYEVWATFRGIQSKKKQLDHFQVSRTPRIDLVIELH